MGEVDGRELEALANKWGGWRWKLCAMEVERLGVGNGGEGGVEVERFEEGWRSGVAGGMGRIQEGGEGVRMQAQPWVGLGPG